MIVLMPLISVGAEMTNSVGDPLTNNVGNNGKLVNPLSVNNFCDLIKVVLEAILVIGMPIAVLFLVYVGFKFIMAQGNPEKIKEAQQNLLNTVIGIAIFLGAWTIAKVIQATLVGLGASGVKECGV